MNLTLFENELASFVGWCRGLDTRKPLSITIGLPGGQVIHSTPLRS